MVFLTKTDGYQKMCDTNKNVIKMGVIIKEVYYIYDHEPHNHKDPFFILVMFVLEHEKLDPTWIPLCCLFIFIKFIMNQKEKHYYPCEFLQPLLIPKSYFQWEKKSSSNSHWLFWKKIILKLHSQCWFLAFGLQYMFVSQNQKLYFTHL